MTTRPPRTTPTRRHRAHRDAGFTVMEVMVAFGILLFVLLAAGGVFLSSVRGQQVAEGTDKATQIATSRIERVRQLDWHMIGFYQADYDTKAAGYDPHIPTDSTGTATVPVPHFGAPGAAAGAGLNLDEARAASKRLYPSYTVTTAATNKNAPAGKYTVYTYLTYKDAGAGSGYQFKKITVRVEWRDGNQTTGKLHTVTTSTLIAPDPSEEIPPGA